MKQFWQRNSRRIFSAVPEQAEQILLQAPGVRVEEVPSHGHAVGIDEVIVGRIRSDHSADNGLALFLISDNLRKGAALNAIQIAETLVWATQRYGAA